MTTILQDHSTVTSGLINSTNHFDATTTRRSTGHLESTSTFLTLPTETTTYFTTNRSSVNLNTATTTITNTVDFETNKILIGTTARFDATNSTKSMNNLTENVSTIYSSMSVNHVSYSTPESIDQLIDLKLISSLTSSINENHSNGINDL